MERKADFIWHNGKFVDWDDAQVHILNHGMHYGIGAFEGIRIYNGKPFAADLHFKRLRKSAASCGIEIEHSDAELIEATRELIQKNNLTTGYVRPITWLEGNSMVLLAPYAKAGIAIAAWPSFYKGRSADQGTIRTPMKLTISDWRKAPPDAFINSKKTTASYMMHYTVRHQAVADGFDDALILNQQGNITEASTANFFLIKDDELITPEPSEFLLGITRKMVIDLANQNGIKVIERAISLEDLEQLQPDAAFLTGTAIELRAIESISFNGKRFDLDPQNKIFNQMLNLFLDHVSKFC